VPHARRESLVKMPALLARMRTRTGPDVFYLIAACAVVHVFMLVAVNLVRSAAVADLYDDWLALSWRALAAGRVWTPWTYALLHDLDGVSHIVFNLLGLYFFGPEVARSLGRRGFWAIAAVAAAAGGLLQATAYALFGSGQILVGVSAVTMALLTAFTLANPKAQVWLFFAVRLPARYLVPIAVGLDLLGWLSGSSVAVLAHLAGVAVGFVAAVGWNWRTARLRLLALAGRLPKGPVLRVVRGGRDDDPPS